MGIWDATTADPIPKALFVRKSLLDKFFIKIEILNVRIQNYLNYD